jgi:hypothetical protein
MAHSLEGLPVERTSPSSDMTTNASGAALAAVAPAGLISIPPVHRTLTFPALPLLRPNRSKSR